MEMLLIAALSFAFVLICGWALWTMDQLEKLKLKVETDRIRLNHALEEKGLILADCSAFDVRLARLKDELENRSYGSWKAKPSEEVVDGNPFGAFCDCGSCKAVRCDG